MAVDKAQPNPLIHKVTLNPGTEERRTKSKLDEIMAEREDRAAQRYSAAELEKMAIESENEVARLRGEPPKYKYGGGNMDDEEKRKKEEGEERKREKLMSSARSLIDSGMEPSQVGQMLLGLTPTNQPSVVTQGMSFKDVTEIINLVTEKKEVSELRSLIASLDKKIDEFARGGGGKTSKEPEARYTDPVTYARQMADANKAYYEALKDIGMIRESGTVTATGEPLEIVKERNRHDERLEELRAEREYKKEMTEIASGIPESVGRGIGGQIRGEPGGNSGSSGLGHIICSDCGTRILTPPETTEVKCPKCNAIYSRKESKEGEAVK